MANMSYCQYRNTSLDMAQCLETLEESYENADTLKEFLDTISEDEHYAFRQLEKRCREFIRMIEEMER